MGIKSYISSVQSELNPVQKMEKAFKNDALKDFLIADASTGGDRVDKVLETDMEKAKRSQTRESLTTRRAGRGLPRQAHGDELSPEVLGVMYKVNPAVRIAVDTIIDIVSSTVWEIAPINKKQRITKGLRNEINRIKTFFTYPNFSREPFRRMLRKWVKDLMISDAGVFEKCRDPETGKLVELYAAWGGTISIDADPNGTVVEYFQVLPGSAYQDVRWSPNDLTYSMLYPSSDRVYGMPKLETLHNTITAFLFAEKRNISFFENDARPSGIVNLGQGISEHQLDRFRSYWMAEHQGSPHKVLFVGGASADTKWVPISMNQKDMEFMQYLNWVFKVILMVFGIAPSQVGWTESNSARTPASAAVLQSAAFKIRVILPILHELSYTFTEDIIRAELGNDELMFKFQEQPSLQERLQKATLNRTLLESKQRTVDEVRSDDGLAPYTAEDKKNLLTPSFGMEMPATAAGAPPPVGGAPALPGAAPAAPAGATGVPGAPIDATQFVTKEDLKTAFNELKRNIEDVTGDLGIDTEEGFEGTEVDSEEEGA